MDDETSHARSHQRATMPSLRTDDAVAAALADEQRQSRARIVSTLRAGLLLSIGLLVGSCGLIFASSGRESNGVGRRTAAYVEFIQTDAEYDCRHTPVSLIDAQCLAAARKLGADWDRDPTPPAWVLFGDRLARFFGFTRGVMGTGGLEAAMALRLVRGSLLFRHARGLPTLKDVADASDRAAILAENAPHVLFADPEIFAFLRSTLDEKATREDALALLLRERLRADIELLSASRVPTSLATARGSTTNPPQSALAERLQKMRALRTLDDHAIRAARVVLDDDARSTTLVTERSGGSVSSPVGHTDTAVGEVLRSGLKNELVVRLWMARAGGSLPAALRILDDGFARDPLALARFLAPGRAQLDDGSPFTTLLAAARADEGAAKADALEKQRHLIVDMLVAAGNGPSRGAACDRLLQRALARARSVDFAVTPMLGCPVPDDLAKRLASLDRPRWEGDGSLVSALALLYGTAMLHPTTQEPLEAGRDAAFHARFGMKPFVFAREKREGGGIVPPSLACSIDDTTSCDEATLPRDLVELARFIRAEP